MDEHQKSLLHSTSLLFPPPKGVKFSYGTAGFRADASLLSSTVFRVGILTALRAVKTGAVIGLMITASHNKVTDNGVKVADPSGGMLTKEWEPFADEIANADGADELVRIIDGFVRKENIDFDGVHPAEILLARDTRPSGVSLIDAAKQGIDSIIGAIANDLGILTTPQLHWMVRARNKGFKATEQDYFEQLVTSYR
ncbi:Phosphoacetylglucosamine mutase-like protein, partial [Drosera capensis]